MCTCHDTDPHLESMTFINAAAHSAFHFASQSLLVTVRWHHDDCGALNRPQTPYGFNTSTPRSRCFGSPSELSAGTHLTVTLTEELGGLASVSGLQLTSRHDNGGNAQLLVGQSALQRSEWSARIERGGCAAPCSQEVMSTRI